MNGAMKHKFYRYTISIGIGFALWQLAYLLIQDELIFPSLFSVFQGLPRLITSPFINDLAATVGRAIMASSVAGIIALPLGIATGLSRSLTEIMSPIADFIRSLPGWILVFPISASFRGSSLEVKHLLVLGISLGAILYLSAIENTRLAPMTRSRIARLYGASRTFIITKILLREVLGSMVAPFLTCLNAGIAIITAVETLTYPSSGVGSRLVQWFNTGTSAADIYGAIVLLGISGIILAAIFRTVFNLAGLLNEESTRTIKQ